MDLPILNTYMNFSRHYFCCFTVAPLFVLDKPMPWNRCLQHPCFKYLCKITQTSKNSDSNAQHFLLDLLTHSWFHSMLFALPCYQFPYTVMNRCFYLTMKWNEFNWSIWEATRLTTMARHNWLLQKKMTSDVSHVHLSSHSTSNYVLFLCQWGPLPLPPRGPLISKECHTETKHSTN